YADAAVEVLERAQGFGVVLVGGVLGGIVGQHEGVDAGGVVVLQPARGGLGVVAGVAEPLVDVGDGWLPGVGADVGVLAGQAVESFQPVFQRQAEYSHGDHGQGRGAGP